MSPFRLLFRVALLAVLVVVAFDAVQYAMAYSSAIQAYRETDSALFTPLREHPNDEALALQVAQDTAAQYNSSVTGFVIKSHDNQNGKVVTINMSVRSSVGNTLLLGKLASKAGATEKGVLNATWRGQRQLVVMQ
jgi:hypothetical protein